MNDNQSVGWNGKWGARPLNNNKPRWTAKITYLHDDGPRDRLFTFDELYELQEIVECGPDFYSIESIVVLINTDEHCPKVTVEEAMRR